MAHSVITFKPADDSAKCKEFERFRNCYLDENRAENSKLYSSDVYNAEELLAISLAYIDGQPYGASSLFHRDCFPAGSVRCVNRFFVLKDFRFGGARYKDLVEQGLGQPRHPVISLEMAFQQSLVAQDYGLNFCFISRELPNRHWCEAMTSGLNAKSGYTWKLKDRVFAVCEATQFSCWQYVMYCDLKQLNRKIEFKYSATEQEIYERFAKSKFLRHSL